MVDTRFHPYAGPLRLGALLADCGAQELVPVGDAAQVLIADADELESAGEGCIALAANRRYIPALRVTKAGVVIVARAIAEDVPEGCIAIVAPNPHDLFVSILERLYPNDTRGIAEAATRPMQPEPVLEQDVLLGRNAVVCSGAEIGRNTIVGPNAVIGAGVTIGRDCIIGAGVSIECAHVGNNVILHAGTRIGTEGFGWLDHGRGNRKIPQLGRVIIQDHVEIGANSTIDRGALGDTVIGEGTKIDNLVQIGHNCRIGRNCLIAAMTGLSGSTVLGDGVLTGGGVGTSGHLSIGAGSIVHGRAAVTKDWPEGSKLAGAPAQDIKDFWREIAALRRLTKGD